MIKYQSVIVEAVHVKGPHTFVGLYFLMARTVQTTLPCQKTPDRFCVIEAETTAKGWALTLTIPAALMHALLGVAPQSGLRLCGNFYSCGDETPAPHYAAWSPVETKAPDFHRPEFFGELELI